MNTSDWKRETRKACVMVCEPCYHGAPATRNRFRSRICRPYYRKQPAWTCATH